MLAIKKEERIRSLIHQGHSNSKIGTDTNSGHEAIQRIRKAMTLTAGCPLDVRERIIFQLIGGFPVKVISADLRVRPEVVLAIHRYYYIRLLRGNKKRMALVCSVCRRDIEAMHEEPPQVHKRVTLRDLTSHADALFDVACDVVSLSDLGVVASPLFCGIASRANDIIKEIRGDTHD